MTKTRTAAPVPTTPYREPTVSDLLPIVAGRITTGYEFMGSKWENCEAEVIALQTITAYALNLKEHGEPLSWLNRGATSGHQMCGTNNAHGLHLLIQDGMLVREPYLGQLKPKDMDAISRDEKGQMEVLRCTLALLKYADTFIEAKAARRKKKSE